jgi:hypothetical protein
VTAIADIETTKFTHSRENRAAGLPVNDAAWIGEVYAASTALVPDQPLSDAVLRGSTVLFVTIGGRYVATSRGVR